MERHEPPSQELAKITKPYPNRELPANAKEFSQGIFTANGIAPRPDSELADLVADMSKDFEDAELSQFLKAQKRFDGPVTMGDTGRKVEHYGLRKCLKELPGYILAAETVGLTYEQAVEILTYTLDSNKYDFSEVEKEIMLLTRAFGMASRYEIKLGEHLDLFKDLIRFGAKEGVLEGTFYAFSIALRLGLSVDQACKVIKKTGDVGSPATGYVTPHFNDALKSMLPAKVDPALVVEAFNLIGDNNGYYSGLYDFFKTIMTFGGPSRGMSPNELLALFVTRVKTGKNIPMLEAGEGDGQKQETIDVPKEKYFIENDSDTLEHTALPYCKIKPLNAGVRDLEKLAVARSHRWEEVGEGMWTFDPESQTWYSFGGQLETPSMEEVLAGRAERVRHNFLPYDLSKLSENPYLFHVHPADYDVFVSPPRENLVYPELQDDITKFLTATPSGADYGTVGELLKESETQVPTRSFISHALGITEFTYPNDIAKLEEMKARSRTIRDQVMLEFDIQSYVQKHGLPVDRLHLVQIMIQTLDERLPEGFSIRLYQTGTDFENAQAVTSLQKDTRGNVKKRLEE